MSNNYTPHTSISVSNWKGRDKDIPMPVEVFKGAHTGANASTFMTVRIASVTFHFQEDDSVTDLIGRLSVAYLEAVNEFNERTKIEE